MIVAYLKPTLYKVTIFPPSLRENGYLMKARYIHISIKAELLLSKASSNNCTKNFLSKKEPLPLSLCNSCTYSCALKLLHAFSSLPQCKQSKHLQGLFPPCFFTRPLNDKTNYKADCKFFILQTLQFEKIRKQTEHNWLLTLKLYLWFKMFDCVFH